MTKSVRERMLCYLELIIINRNRVQEGHDPTRPYMKVRAAEARCSPGRPMAVVTAVVIRPTQ